MLTVRSFRNEDPPRLLELWQNTQQRQDSFAPLPPLSLSLLQTQILGLPMLDARTVRVALDNGTPVGYVHTTPAPSEDGYSFNFAVGQICFLCVDPQYPDADGAVAALLQSGEEYLKELGAVKIFGGSPSPSAPFYTGFHSGGEAVGLLLSDEPVMNAFHHAGYQLHQKTVWFHYTLPDHPLTPTPELMGYINEFEVEIAETSQARTWWAGCAFAHGIWFDATAYSLRPSRPVARLRTRVTYPDTEHTLTMYSGTWLASLMELRVHPDFADIGIQKFLLGELIRYLISYNQIVQIEAHVAEDTPLFTLLRSQSWTERNYGCVFVKEL